jgi:glycosyltransferase involved in cell wall biosynthesis
MNAMPFFSICIPTYKNDELLKKLLISIEEQSFKDYEVIISDDSDDSSIENVVNFKWSFKIYYSKNEIALGSPENWNNAISKAKGKWVKIMHHDDYFYQEDALKIMHDEIQKNLQIDFFFCSTILLNSKTKKESKYLPKEKFIQNLKNEPINLFLANVIGAPSATIFRRNISETFDKSLIWLVDIEFYTRIILNYKSFRIKDYLIVTNEGLETQLTTALKDNKKIDLFEITYCYNKLINFINTKNKRIFTKVIFEMIDKYKIESYNEIPKISKNSLYKFFIYNYANTKSFIVKRLIRILNNSI